MRRRLLLFFALLGAGVVVLLATLPFWLGAALGAVGGPRGLTFRSYERIGYSRFALRDAEVRRGNVRVTLSRAEADTPLLWLWRHWRDADREVVADTWQVEVAKSTVPPLQPASPRGWLPLRTRLNRLADSLSVWLPRARTGSGVVRWPGGEISVAGAVWRDRQLQTTALAYRAYRADTTIAFLPQGAIRLDLRSDDGRVRLVSEDSRVTGEGKWWEQPANVLAEFNPTGWLPREASLVARDWDIPGARLKLERSYQTVKGSAELAWSEHALRAQLNARGDPVGDRVPPLELVAAANGDGRTFTLQSLRATVPGIEARLTAPVTVARTGAIQGSGAQLALSIDVAKQPWIAGSGRIEGRAQVVGSASEPSVGFELKADGLTANGVRIQAAGLHGHFKWPRLEVQRGTLVGAANDELQWSGAWDFKTKSVADLKVAGVLDRATLARWLPAQPAFDSVRVTARASGPLATMLHSGELEAAQVMVRGLKPLAVTLSWKGEGLAADPVTAVVKAENSSVVARARVERTSARIDALDFSPHGDLELALRGPATIAWSPGLQWSNVHLAGPKSAVDTAGVWGREGRFEFAVRGFHSSWLNDFVSLPGPTWSIGLLGATGRWNGGAMTHDISGSASLDLGEQRTAAVNFAAEGDEHGLRIKALRASEGEATVFNATGQVPLVVRPGQKPIVGLDASGTVAFVAKAEPNAAFWEKVAGLTGFELRAPRIDAQVDGTWRSPRGKVTFVADRIAAAPERFKRPLPAIEDVDVQLAAEANGLKLDRVAFKVEGQPVRAHGRLPVPAGGWGELRKRPLHVARAGVEMRLEVPEAEIADFTRYLPAYLAPQGKIALDVHYRGGAFDGFLRLRDAASRPLGPLGVMQEISADLHMSGRKLTFTGVSAKAGGQPVTLTGTVELPVNGHPRYNLALRGDNLPFVRQTGLLLRGDLDLKLQTLADQNVPRISGVVRLRDSLFLQDVRAFIPAGGAGASRRPPYFEVDTPPLDRWTLAVDVVGREFLRLRTPVFNGVASARFHLGGTLGEPRAIGEATVDQGWVRMPFASFAVTQGAVRLTEADPYQPAIYLRGTARRYGYDITMEIEGPGTTPNVTFVSSPALDSEQVVLMVMTGAAPKNEIARSSGHRVAQIGYFLGKSLWGSLGADSGDAEKLTIASGEKISRQGRETYDIEYQLTDRWTLTGEYNEFDEYNAGMKWRIFPRPKKTAPETGVATDAGK